MAEKDGKDVVKEKPLESTPIELDKLFPKVEEIAEKVKEKSEADDTDVKQKKAPSSGESDEDKEVEDEDELRTQVNALQKELARVRKNKNESTEEVQGLREQLAKVQGQLEVLVQGNKSSNKMADYSDAQLVRGQTEWEDELLESRQELHDARKGDDKAALAEAQKKVTIAKQTLDAIRQELLDRTKRSSAEQAKTQGEANKIVEEVVDLYDTAYETFPELKDKDSEIWQAGNEEYMARPSLMKQLGPLGELVAIAVAISKNPELVGGKAKAKAVRKDLLEEINDKAEAALLKGGGKAKGKSVTNFADLGDQDFERVVSKIKMGG